MCSSLGHNINQLQLHFSKRRPISSPFASEHHLKAACVPRGLLVPSVPRTRLMLNLPKFPPLTHLPLHSPKPHQEEQQILSEEPGPNKCFSQLIGKRTKRISLTVLMALKRNQKAALKKKSFILQRKLLNRIQDSDSP